MARPRIGLVPIPIEHDGVHYPSRKALAQHLAAIKGGAIGSGKRGSAGSMATWHAP